MIRALAGVMLRGSLPTEHSQQAAGLTLTIAGVERAIARQPDHIRTELRELFDLLQLAPTRLLLCGFWGGWSTADPAAIDSFLQWWRSSRLELLRLAYLSLHELIVGSYYSTTLSWTHAGYDGPPELERTATEAG